MAQVRRTRSRDTISEHNRRIEAYERIEMSGQMILVPAPDPVPPRRLFGHEDAVEKALAAWWRHADGTRCERR